MRTLYLLIAAVMVCVSPVLAQQPDEIETGNEFVKAVVLGRSGQFHIMTADGKPLSFSGAGQWNSHTNFKLNSNGTDYYFTNQVQKLNNSAIAGKLTVLQLPDSSTKIGDTIRTYWANLRGFTVVQDVFPIKTSDGGQIVLRYSVAARDENTTTRFKGVLVMLDLQVYPPGSDQCSLDADKPLVLTSLLYDARTNGGTASGVCWTGVERRYTDSTGMPDWYIAGMRFPDFGAPGTLLGKGILTGPGLVTPNEFIVADWGRSILGLKDSSWDFYDLIKNRDYNDAAVLYKWNMNVVGTSQPRVVATAYGMNDYGEYFNLCGAPLMMLGRISPRHHYRDARGKFDSLNTVVDVYVMNGDHQERSTQQDTVTLEMNNAPHMIIPSPLKKLPLITGTTSSSLGKGNIGMARWNILIDTNKINRGQDYDESFGFQVATSNIPSMNDTCHSLTTVSYHAGAPDNTPPSVKVLSSTRTRVQWLISDSTANDFGLDSIEVLDSSNYIYLPTQFTRCTPSSVAQVVLQVRNQQKDAHFLIRVHDCQGNATLDSVVYTVVPISVEQPTGAPHSLSITSFPNPFSTMTDLYFTGPASGLVNSVRVYSALGADVTPAVQPHVTDIGDARRIRIDGRALSPGMYTVAAVTQSGTLRHTIVVVR